MQRVILFGSLVWGNPGLTSDIDLILIWDTPLGFLERTAEVYRRLQPQVAADLFVYTPDELTRMAHTPFVRRALAEGRVLYEEALRLTDQALHLLRAKLRPEEPASQ
jgi:predicted nucleotidyltransferase